MQLAHLIVNYRLKKFTCIKVFDDLHHGVHYDPVHALGGCNMEILKILKVNLHSKNFLKFFLS